MNLCANLAAFLTTQSSKLKMFTPPWHRKSAIFFQENSCNLQLLQLIFCQNHMKLPRHQAMKIHLKMSHIIGKCYKCYARCWMLEFSYILDLQKIGPTILSLKTQIFNIPFTKLFVSFLQLATSSWHTHHFPTISSMFKKTGAKAVRRRLHGPSFRKFLEMNLMSKGCKKRGRGREVAHVCFQCPIMHCFSSHPKTWI